ncbi:hypothetical protein EVG20_g4721 [Dentipellis fragilis]|uniref:Uncharacterized protein n=1 Tax=Dentipellis fragilis TaxID=205917 RepID=A0A4Y9YZ15_9AGAM|nr:hypothetical protein EVG20_g4721 [Dentipellis fragilis]
MSAFVPGPHVRSTLRSFTSPANLQNRRLSGSLIHALESLSSCPREGLNAITVFPAQAHRKKVHQFSILSRTAANPNLPSIVLVNGPYKRSLSLSVRTKQRTHSTAPRRSFLRVMSAGQPAMLSSLESASQAPTRASGSSSATSTALITPTSSLTESESFPTMASRKTTTRPPPLDLSTSSSAIMPMDDPLPRTPRAASSDTSSLGSTTRSSRGLSPPESPCARRRRAPPRSCAPSVRTHNVDGMQIVEIPLPCPGGKPFCAEMVTIAAKKGDRLRIIADAWHLEQDCHFEWDFAFEPRTVDMSTLRAKVEADGKLVITVRKLRAW